MHVRLRKVSYVGGNSKVRTQKSGVRSENLSPFGTKRIQRFTEKFKLLPATKAVGWPIIS